MHVYDIYFFRALRACSPLSSVHILPSHICHINPKDIYLRVPIATAPSAFHVLHNGICPRPMGSHACVPTVAPPNAPSLLRCCMYPCPTGSHARVPTVVPPNAPPQLRHCMCT